MPKICISLPQTGQISVKVGDHVLINDVLAKFEDKKKIQINLAVHFKMKPQKVASVLKIKNDDKVEMGDVIACHKSILAKQSYKSPVKGIMESFDEATGVLTITTSSASHLIHSPVEGIIEEIKDSKSIYIDFKGEVFNVKQALGNKIGKIRVINSGNESFDNFYINKEMEHMILVGYKWSKISMIKAIALDCGIIGVEFEGDVLKPGSNKYLAGEIPSYMMIGRDVFEKLSNKTGVTGVMLGNEKELFIAEKN